MIVVDGKIEDWLSIAKASERLTQTLKRPVTNAAVLELAISEQIRLSIRIFTALLARRCVATPIEDSFFDDAASNSTGKNAELLQKAIDVVFHYEGHSKKIKNIISLDGMSEFIELRGFWDLEMFGLGGLQVRSEFIKLKSISFHNYQDGDGIYLIKVGDNQPSFQILQAEVFDELDSICRIFNPIEQWPDNVEIVIRKNELERYERLEKPECVAQTPGNATQPLVSTEANEPLQRGFVQDAAILRAIRDLNYDPAAFPKNPSGKPGVKAKIRDALVGKIRVFPREGSQFDKAWYRLRSDRKIVDA